MATRWKCSWRGTAATSRSCSCTMNRDYGPYGWSYWALILFNMLVPQCLWSGRARQQRPRWYSSFRSSSTSGCGWSGFVIIVTSLHRDFLPVSWGMYYPTVWDWSLFVGTIGLFLDADVPVHSRAAGDFDFRNAHDSAARGEGRPPLAMRKPLYGLMAEFAYAGATGARLRNGASRRLPEDGCLFAAADRRIASCDAPSEYAAAEVRAWSAEWRGCSPAWVCCNGFRRSHIR